ncbi:MAG: heavy metal-responsive transcriptional regulator [Gammaproteobacteria bacterium]|jgi:Hg(II)-responsive transcriptional regulator|nr:heavy metal-responsive transcriptional regulator [Gammaproteobacteria bacterium]
MNAPEDTSLTIGRVAKLAGVGIDTVRFYERRGLLPEARRSAAGYRQYAAGTIDRLQFIRRAKALGFSLEEIGTLLDLQDNGGSKSAVKAITARKLAQIDAKLADLSRMRSVLHNLHQDCSGAGNVCGCPIIDALAHADDLPLPELDT